MLYIILKEKKRQNDDLSYYVKINSCKIIMDDEDKQEFIQRLIRAKKRSKHRTIKQSTGILEIATKYDSQNVPASLDCPLSGKEAGNQLLLS